MIKFVCPIINKKILHDLLSYKDKDRIFNKFNLLYSGIFRLLDVYLYTSSCTKYIAIGERKLVFRWAFMASELTFTWHGGSKLGNRKLSAFYFFILLSSFIDIL